MVTVGDVKVTLVNVEIGVEQGEAHTGHDKRTWKAQTRKKCKNSEKSEPNQDQNKIIQTQKWR